MGAAFALAGSVAKQEHERNGGALKFVLETPINLRPHCGIPDKLMGPFVTSFPDNVTVKSTTRFWDKATSSKSSLEFLLTGKPACHLWNSHRNANNTSRQ